MSAIIGLGEIQKTPPTHGTITWESTINKFEALSKEILFGPGLVTRFTCSMLESLHVIDEYFYRKIHEVSMQESNASFLLHSKSHSHSACYYSSNKEGSSRENSLSEVIEIDGVQYEVSKDSSDLGSDTDEDALPLVPILTDHSDSFAHLFMQKVFYPPA